MSQWKHLLVGCLLFAGVQAHAQPPSVRLITPYPPGGAADQLARTLSAEMKTRYDVTVIVDNRPGAGAQVAMREVKNANPALGPVLFLADSGAYAGNQYLYKNLNYNVDTDLMPMTLVAKAPVFLLVNQNSPIHSIQDLVDRAKQKDLMYGSPGVGTTTHLLGEMLREQTDTRLVHVAYRGAGPALIDAVSGEIDFIFDVLIGSRAYLDEGRLRVIATAGNTRTPLRPDTPTLAESGIPNVALAMWWAIAAQAGTDPTLTARLTEQLSAILKDPTIVQKFSPLGIELQASTPVQLTTLIKQDSQVLGEVIRSLNISLD